MLTTIAATTAGIAAGAAYLDAKFHIRNDLALAPLNPNTRAARKFIADAEARGKMRVYHLLEGHALADRPGQVFLEFEGRSWTYKQFYCCVQRVGNWLIDNLGIKAGEMVALSGANTAEYVMIWMGLQAVGAVVSHVNCHLRSDAFAHCVKISEARHVLVDRDMEHSMLDSTNMTGMTIAFYDQTFVESLPDKGPIPRDRNADFTQESTSVLIYTSGTTGLPKAVGGKAGREYSGARSMAKYLKLKRSDKFYTCLPLYHAAAQGLCMSPVIYAGGSVRLARRFSHKTFWSDVVESKATRLQYVGEICRYLVNAPLHPLERSHVIEEAWGNGMRPDVWEIFRERFGIPVIHELYAGTDALSASFNRNRGPFSSNAIAVRGAMWNWMMSEREVRGKIDPDTEELFRNEEGFAIRAGTNEPGETLHKIDAASASFAGYYNNPAASSKRYLSDVFTKGDLWFRSGDVMRVDSAGRVFFVDRLGDTFRWKSENVSTTEVADVLSGFEQIDECAVYGVTIPHADGRCGCATIVTSKAISADLSDFNFRELARYLIERLPRYAVPVFLRIVPELSYTGNYKIQKAEAKKEGVDLSAITQAGSKEQMYWIPPGSQSYVPYRAEDWAALRSGQVKL